MTNASGTYKVTASQLNVRTGNGTTYKKAGTLKKGKQIKVNGKTSNGWYRFSFNGKNHYVSGKHITAVKPKTSQKKKTVPDVAKTSIAKKTNQIVTVVGNGSKATVEYWYKDKKGDWKKSFTTNGHVGSQGVGKTREGLGKTPKGAFKLGGAFGTSNPGTKMPFKKITKNSYWISNINDKQYNTWQERKSSSKADEHLIQYPVQYKYGIVINYNTTKPVKGAGSAFFLHVDNGRPTAGCVSIPESRMVTLMKELNSNAYIINVNKKSEIVNY